MIYLTVLVLRLPPGILYLSCIHCVLQEADPDDEVRSARDISIYERKRERGAGRGRKILQATVKV